MTVAGWALLIAWACASFGLADRAERDLHTIVFALAGVAGLIGIGWAFGLYA